MIHDMSFNTPLPTCATDQSGRDTFVGNAMELSLAKGYASRFLQSLIMDQTLLNFVHSSKYENVKDQFGTTTSAKKLGRGLLRIRKSLPDYFSDPHVACWTKHLRVVYTSTITLSNHAVFESGAGDHFEDRAAFLHDMIMVRDGRGMSQGMVTSASISKHALTRMLQRGLAKGDTIEKHGLNALYLARSINEALGTDLEAKRQTWSFLIPYGGGAFVATNYPCCLIPGHTPNEYVCVSIRTWLAPEMLQSHDLIRMKGFMAAQEDGQFLDLTLERTLENARPRARRFAPAYA